MHGESCSLRGWPPPPPPPQLLPAWPSWRPVPPRRRVVHCLRGVAGGRGAQGHTAQAQGSPGRPDAPGAACVDREPGATRGRRRTGVSPLTCPGRFKPFTAVEGADASILGAGTIRSGAVVDEPPSLVRVVLMQAQQMRLVARCESCTVPWAQRRVCPRARQKQAGLQRWRLQQHPAYKQAARTRGWRSWQPPVGALGPLFESAGRTAHPQLVPDQSHCVHACCCAQACCYSPALRQCGPVIAGEVGAGWRRC
jgi:hypothetical protein